MIALEEIIQRKVDAEELSAKPEKVENYPLYALAPATQPTLTHNPPLHTRDFEMRKDKKENQSDELFVQKRSEPMGKAIDIITIRLGWSHKQDLQVSRLK